MSAVDGRKVCGAKNDGGVSLDKLDVATHPARDAVYFRRIIAARKQLAAAETELPEAVAAARKAGDSWTVIGAALDITRQAAQQRSGRVQRLRTRYHASRRMEGRRPSSSRRWTTKRVSSLGTNLTW